jgi:hypothetical protein
MGQEYCATRVFSEIVSVKELFSEVEFASEVAFEQEELIVNSPIQTANPNGRNKFSFI